MNPSLVDLKLPMVPPFEDFELVSVQNVSPGGGALYQLLHRASRRVVSEATITEAELFSAAKERLYDIIDRTIERLTRPLRQELSPLYQTWDANGSPVD